MSFSHRLCASVVAVAFASTASFAQPSGAGVQAPSLKGNSGCGPDYPDVSRRFEETGSVLVRALVDADGVPSQTVVERSSGFERLDKAAIAAVSCFRFTPGSIGGSPSPMWIQVPIRFVLK
jgi:periplasmic protein TonB